MAEVAELRVAVLAMSGLKLSVVMMPVAPEAGVAGVFHSTCFKPLKKLRLLLQGEC